MLKNRVSILLILVLLLIGSYTALWISNGGKIVSYQADVNVKKDYSLKTVGLSKTKINALAAELIQKKYGSNFQINEIFVFENSPYYISIKEKESPHSAFEVLFDPFEKQIYSTYGPKLTWNTKYGSNSYGMFGMNYTIGENKFLNKRQALEKAKEFYKDKPLIRVDKGHKYYGYYTFYTKVSGEINGMLSINTYTGEVWNHSWHGKLEAII